MTMSAFGTAGRSHGNDRFGGGRRGEQNSLGEALESTNREAKKKRKSNQNPLNFQRFIDMRESPHRALCPLDPNFQTRPRKRR